MQVDVLVYARDQQHQVSRKDPVSPRPALKFTAFSPKLQRPKLHIYTQNSFVLKSKRVRAEVFPPLIDSIFSFSVFYLLLAR